MTPEPKEDENEFVAEGECNLTVENTNSHFFLAGQNMVVIEMGNLGVKETILPTQLISLQIRPFRGVNVKSFLVLCFPNIKRQNQFYV